MLEKERGATGDDTPSKWQDGNNIRPFKASPSRNQLVRADASAPPVLLLCRELLRAGLDPDAAVETYRQAHRPLVLDEGRRAP
jgi:hypothetical protein